MTDSGATTFAYAQWVTIDISNKNKTRSIKIKNVSLSYGKFHTQGNKGNEIPPSDITNTVVKPGDAYIIYSCGRGDSPSGTTGTFDLVDMTSGSTIRTFVWDCPWGGKTNKVELQGSNSSWIVEPNGFNLDSGALGNGKLLCVYIGDL